MAKYEIRVRQVTTIPYPRVLIEAEDEDEAEEKARDMEMRGELGESMLEKTEVYVEISIRDVSDA